jgi:outer membrane receptor protein involved in Fe transport
VAGLLNTSNFARAMPRLRATIPIGWNMDGHTVTVIGNFIGSYNDDFDSDPAAPVRVDPMNPMSAIADWNEEYRPIDSWITFDLQYALKIEETEHLATTIKVGVINLLDSDPPPVNIGYGYDFTTHDPRGRLLYARLTQEF